MVLKDSHKKHRTMSMVAKEDESNGSVDSINSNNVVAEISEESDNYKYFDYEKTWLTRRRENYKFVKEKRQTFKTKSKQGSYRLLVCFNYRCYYYY